MDSNLNLSTKAKKYLHHQLFTNSNTFSVIYSNCSSESSVCIGNERTHSLNFSATGKSPAL